VQLFTTLFFYNFFKILFFVKMYIDIDTTLSIIEYIILSS